MNETILSCSESTTIYDLGTGNSVASLKIPPSSPHCATIIQTKNGQGGLIFSSPVDKSLLYVYSFQKDQPLHKLVLPEKLSCLNADDSGNWFVGGTASGRVYLWEVASGALFACFAAHYRAVTTIQFYSNGQYFVTGSEDSVISIWSLSRVVDYELENQAPTPLHTLNEHTLPITSVYLGVGSLSSTRLFSSSLDNTVRVWSIDYAVSEAGSTVSHLLGFSLPAPVSELAVDPAERFFFAATTGEKGEVYLIKMYRQTAERRPGQAPAFSLIGETRTVEKSSNMITVGAKVMSMGLSLTSRLLVGTPGAEVKIFDSNSLQLLKTIRTTQSPSPFPVTFLCALAKPPDLIGNAQLSLNGNQGEEATPVRPVMPFGRARDVKGKGREVSIVLPYQPNNRRIVYNPMEDYTVLSSQRNMSTTDRDQKQHNSEARIEQLASEVEDLKRQLDKARSINDAMWENLVQATLVKSKRSSPPE